MAHRPTYTLQLDVVHSGFDKRTCWVHGRACAIPGDPALVVLTMQKLLLSGSDVFYALNEMRSADCGETWSGPVAHEAALGRREEGDGIVACICDFTPKWHAHTGRLLGIGQVARYLDNSIMPDPRPRHTAYSVYDSATRQWTPWAVLAMPNEDKFFSSGAGSTQRYDLPSGDILLPIYFKPGGQCYAAAVMRCSFDGTVLRYVEHGSEHTVDDPRGLCEPSLTRFQDRYYLTLRNDVCGYVTSGHDGLHFDPPRPWTFDDGSELGNYNTQQHWVTHRDGLFLVYTRRGADNDHVFRHRAPLFMAQVDPDRLCVLRGTERIIVPEHGARLGNFGVCDVNENETWVVVCEWMQPVGCEKHGSDNRVYAARILWDRPNRVGAEGNA